MFAFAYQPPTLSAGPDPTWIFTIGILVGLVLLQNWSQVKTWHKTALALVSTVGALAIIWWPCWLYPFCDGGGGGW